MVAGIARRCLGVAATLALSAMVVSAVRADTPPATPYGKPSRELRAAAAAPAHPKAALERKAAKDKDAPFLIVAFGSSSTQGVGATGPDHTYPAQAQQLFVRTFGTHPAVVVINRGIGGEDIDDMMKRLQRDVLARAPDLVIWQAGSNDILRGVPLARFKEELRAGVAAIRAAGAEVILIEPQWCPAFSGRGDTMVLVEAMRAFASAERVPLVRRYDLMQQWVSKGLIRPNELVGRDGLHMTDHGYELLAKAVFDQVQGTSKRFRATIAGLGQMHM